MEDKTKMEEVGTAEVGSSTSFNQGFKRRKNRQGGRQKESSSDGVYS